MTVSEEVRRELAEFARGTDQYSLITTRASLVGNREVDVEFHCDYDDIDDLNQEFEELVRSHEKALGEFETLQHEESTRVREDDWGGFVADFTFKISE